MADSRQDQSVNNPLKRKRAIPPAPPADSKLAEYLDLMGRKRTGAAIEQVDARVSETMQMENSGNDDWQALNVTEDSSDQEYQQMEKPLKRQAQQSKIQKLEKDINPPSLEAISTGPSQKSGQVEAEEMRDELVQDTDAHTATDADWLRSRTSRLLGLLEENEELEVQKSPVRRENSESDIISGHEHETEVIEEPDLQAKAMAQSQPLLNVTAEAHENTEETIIEKSQRLFLRNLAYDVVEDDLRTHFAAFGDLEEVSDRLQSPHNSP